MIRWMKVRPYNNYRTGKKGLGRVSGREYLVTSGTEESSSHRILLPV